VRDAVSRLGVTYPVMLDADYSYWNALGNRYWPPSTSSARRDASRATAIGELHLDDARGERFEDEIRSLLADR
jgi:hypothetical protein